VRMCPPVTDFLRGGSGVKVMSLRQCRLRGKVQFFCGSCVLTRKGAAGQNVNTCGVPATCGCYHQARHMQM
jgi:hypothetical protein